MTVAVSTDVESYLSYLTKSLFQLTPTRVFDSCFVDVYKNAFSHCHRHLKASDYYKADCVNGRLLFVVARQ